MTYAADVNVDSIAHYGVIGMKWGIRRTPEQLGHAPRSEQRAFRKELKADSKEYRKLRRDVTATQKNLQSRARLEKIDRGSVLQAEKDYEKSLSKREPFFRRGKLKRQEVIAQAEKFLDREMERHEWSEGKKRQALENTKKAVDRLESFLAEMSDKYGSENVKDIPRKDVTTGILWWKEVQMEDGFKTPMNLARAPLIGRSVSSKIVNNMEREQRDELMTERLNDYERKKYA